MNELYINNTEGGSPTQITFGYDDWHPSWPPDGTTIAFTSNRSGNADIWIMPSNGGNALQITTNSADDDRVCWSPDCQSIAFGSTRTGNEEIWMKYLMDGSIEQLTFHDGYDSHPDWSPDGSKIAFASMRSGNLDVWVTDISTTTHNNNVLQKNFDIYNFPNPFHLLTTIEYEIAQKTKVVLKIYDLFGKEVINLVDEIQNKGIHSVVWDGTNNSGNSVSPGVYYCIIQVGNCQKSEKLLFINK